MSESRFHFSPRPNRAAEAGWLDWGPEAFERAQREDKPVLLGISAVWCHWCHVMDETSYSDPQVLDLIRERFVPVRVDNDQRPDINARYNMGGWPTTAFLTPQGEVLAGMTYIPPDQMRDVLNQVSQYYKDNREAIEQKLAEIAANRERASSADAADDALSEQILRDVLLAASDQYDPVHGGFGNEPKFPHTDAIDLLLHAYLRDGDRDALHMARKTLERMCDGGTYDQEWGGFYRYSTKRDWSVPHYEKMLEDNAQLLQNLCKLYRITGDDAHRRAIERTIAYVDEWLSDGESGAFYGSQDADEEFYPLPAAERAKHAAPYVDRTVYTAWNAMAVSACLEASWTLARPELRERALRAIDFLFSRLYVQGDGMHRYLDGDGPRVAGLLADQAYTAIACLDAYEAASRPQDLERARALAVFLLDRLQDVEAGGFFDAPPGHDSLGRLAMRQKPLKENSAAATALLRLHRLTRDDAYETAARRTLAQYAHVAESQGHFAAAYAKAVDLLLHPGAEVKVVAAGAAAAPLRDAALALAVPARTVRVFDPGDAAALAAEALPAQPSPAAYACYGTLCSAPATTPAALVETVAETRRAYESTRRLEPLAGPRGERASD